MSWTEAEYAAYLAKQQEKASRRPRPALTVEAPAGPRSRSKTEAQREQQYASKTEARYALLLRGWQADGTIATWWYEGVKLRLARTTFYTPDFLLCFPDGHLECREVKGFWRDDARVKIKVAAAQYPCFTFIAVQWKKGRWQEEYF